MITPLVDKWKQEDQKVLALNGHPCPYIIELVCALERLLVFAHTGNTVVLHKPTIGNLFMIQGVLENRFPMISPGVVSYPPGGVGIMTINCKCWPLVRGLRVLVIGSQATQLLYYKLLVQFLVSPSGSTQFLVLY